jgi:glycosyltransferase involved in cell wall biosynthesis
VADRALHIGVDGRELVGKPTGVGRYLSNLLRIWLGEDALSKGSGVARGAEHSRPRFTVFLPAPPPADLVALGGRIAWQVAAAPVAGTWWEQTTLAQYATKAGVDVLFAPAYTAPLLFSRPIVLVIHDLSYFAHPEWFGWREGVRRRWVTREAAKRASTIIAVSQFSADEIVRRLHVSSGRVIVAPHGAPAVVPGPSIRRPPTVLFVGSLFNRRRIPELVAGFADAARQVAGAKLVLVGDNRTHPPIDPLAIAADLGVASSVEWRRYVPDAELHALYASARVFAFLSEYEGFAMTPLEAIAHGVPPVLLDTPVAREVYGSAARFVTLDRAAIGAALAELLVDEDAHRQLAAAGPSQLARYSWPKSAATVMSAIERAAAG